MRFGRLPSVPSKQPACRLNVCPTAVLCEKTRRSSWRRSSRQLPWVTKLVDTCPVFLANPSDSRLQRRGQPQRIRADRPLHSESLLIASWGVETAMPNSAGVSPKSRRLNVTSASALPFIAASRTISSEGSRSLGRHRNRLTAGSATAQSAEMTVQTSDARRPDARRCTGSQHIASYSRVGATEEST